MIRFVTIILLCLTSIASANSSITFAFTCGVRSSLEPRIDDEDSASVGGFARMATAIKNIRLTSDRFFLIDCGDHFAGWNYACHSGAPEISAMNYLRYDAMALGATELSMGTGIFSKWARKAKFPILACNIREWSECDICRYIAPYTIIERGGVSVGVFSIISPKIKSRERMPLDIDFDFDRSIALNIVRRLRGRCDFIVFLSRIFPDEIRDFEEVFRYVDIVVSISDKQIEVVANTITEKGFDNRGFFFECDGTNIIVVKASIDSTNRFVDCEFDKIAIDEKIALDPRALELLKEFSDSSTKTVLIGSVLNDLDGRDKVLRGAESNLGNIVADASLSAFPGADLALIPASSFYGDRIIKAGIFTDKNIFEILPFRERLVLVELSGDEIRYALGLTICLRDCSSGGFFQIAGIIAQFDTLRKIIKDESGREAVRTCRVDVIIGDGNIDDKKIYKVVTTEYIASGGHGYFLFREKSNKIGGFLTDAVIDYFRKKSPISGDFDERIRIEP